MISEFEIIKKLILLLNILCLKYYLKKIIFSKIKKLINKVLIIFLI